jgi:HAE1 family hydrophobic/amphiphilic exporter-1
MTFRRIEDVIHDTIPELKNQNTDLGVGETFGAFAKGSYAGKIRVSLIDKENRKRTQIEIEGALREKLERIPGITFSITQGNFLGEEGDLIIYVYGEDLDTARILSDTIKGVIKEVPGAVDVTTSLESGRPELQITLDRDRISVLGLSAFQVANTISTFIKGTTASLFRDQGEEYDILVRLDPKYRESTAALDNLFVANPRGEQIPLSSIAQVRRGISPTSILRRDQQRVVNVSVTVQGRSLGEVAQDVEERLKKMEISSDFSYETLSPW